MKQVYIHESAIVDDGAELGSGCKVWHWAHICSGAIIGENCSFGQNVFVGNDVKIGRGVKVQNNVSVYDSVELQDNVFCGPSVVFTNVYNPRSAIARRDEYRKTLIKTGATLGANCTIICGVQVGQYAFVGAGSVVRTDIPDFALYVGVPARHVGWMDMSGQRIQLPLVGNSSYCCDRTGVTYSLKDGRVTAHKN